MALSLLSAVSGWWTGHIGAPAVQSNIVDPVNAAIDAINAIQYGDDTVTVTASPDGTQTVTFPRAFATTPHVVATNTSTANRDFGIQVTAKSTTQATFRAHHFDGTNATTTVQFDWIAIAL